MTYATAPRRKTVACDGEHGQQMLSLLTSLEEKQGNTLAYIIYTRPFLPNYVDAKQSENTNQPVSLKKITTARKRLEQLNESIFCLHGRIQVLLLYDVIFSFYGQNRWQYIISSIVKKSKDKNAENLGATLSTTLRMGKKQIRMKWGVCGVSTAPSL